MRRDVAGAVSIIVATVAALGAVLLPMPARPAPTPATRAEVERIADEIVAATWDNTGLPGPQPTTPPAVLDGAGTALQTDGLTSCVADSGYFPDGFGWGGGVGYMVSGPDGRPVQDDAALAAWFECVAQFPLAGMGREMLASDSERAAMRRYQMEWIAPCVLLQGYPVSAPLSSADGGAIASRSWSAYEGVWNAGLSEADMNRVTDDCGPVQAGWDTPDHLVSIG